MEAIVDDLERVWEVTSEHAGISKTFYNQYFKNKKKAVAYRLGEVEKYSNPLSLKDFGLNFAPQSFVYINKKA